MPRVPRLGLLGKAVLALAPASSPSPPLNPRPLLALGGGRPRDGGVLALEIEQIHLSRWAVEDAHACWSELRKRRAGTIEITPTERTPLAVDVQGRR